MTEIGMGIPQVLTPWQVHYEGINSALATLANPDHTLGDQLRIASQYLPLGIGSTPMTLNGRHDITTALAGQVKCYMPELPRSPKFMGEHIDFQDDVRLPILRHSMRRVFDRYMGQGVMNENLLGMFADVQGLHLSLLKDAVADAFVSPSVAANFLANAKDSLDDRLRSAREQLRVLGPVTRPVVSANAVGWTLTVLPPVGTSIGLIIAGSSLNIVGSYTLVAGLSGLLLGALVERYMKRHKICFVDDVMASERSTLIKNVERLEHAETILAGVEGYAANVSSFSDAAYLPLPLDRPEFRTVALREKGDRGALVVRGGLDLVDYFKDSQVKQARYAVVEMADETREIRLFTDRSDEEHSVLGVTEAESLVAAGNLLFSDAPAGPKKKVFVDPLSARFPTDKFGKVIDKGFWPIADGGFEGAMKVFIATLGDEADVHPIPAVTLMNAGK